MQKRGIEERINNPKIKQILLIFASPKTPKQAERELCVSKIKLKSFLKEHLLECLNPEAKKGRLYVASEGARKCLNLSPPITENSQDWEIIGWVISSPKQRLVIMRCINNRKLASEEIRMMATQFNCNLTRPATKVALRDLVQKHLLDSEILERIRFYWLNSHGQRIKEELAVVAPISPGFFAT